MTDRSDEKADLLEKVSPFLDELRTASNLIQGALYLQTNDTDRYLLVRPLMCFGSYKIAIKEITSRGEGSGAYFELHDDKGINDYISRQLDRVLEPAQVPLKLRQNLDTKRSALQWKLVEYGGIHLK